MTPLHYITDLRNLPSVLRLGILCSRYVADHNLSVVGLGKEKYLNIRRNRFIEKRSLDEFVSLYLTAQTPLLYAREQDDTFKLVCVEIARHVLYGPNVYYCAGNPTRHSPIVAAKTANVLDGQCLSIRTFAEVLGMKHANKISEEEFELRKNALEAEVLVLSRVDSKYFERIIFKTETDKLAFEAETPKRAGLIYSVDRSHFFRSCLEA
jgi:hypothetical protein